MLKWFGVLLLSGCGAAAIDPCASNAKLDPDSCLLPWPSSAFLVSDARTRTGYRVRIPLTAMPQGQDGKHVDPAPWNRWDGFEPMTTMMAQFSSVIDPTPLPRWNDPGASLAAGSPTVLIDAESGERIAHFSEIEASPEVAPGHTTLYVRPAARLQEGRHYVVAVRGLDAADGGPVAVSPRFRALRDRLPGSPAVQREAFEKDVFAPLARAGVARGDLLLAWDFRTASGPSAWQDMVDMRDAAFRLGGPVDCAVTDVSEDPQDPQVFRRVHGTFSVPSFLGVNADGEPVLLRDAQGRPAAGGTATAQFSLIVPRSALAASPAPLFVYGHGQFSTRDELARDFGLATLAQAGAVGAATDFIGLAQEDQGKVVSAFLDLAHLQSIVDRLRQGLLNTLLLPSALRGPCATSPALSVDGRPLLDGQHVNYFGNSLGGTLGVTLAALSPDIQRFAIGVGAMNYPLMMPRATGWPALEAFFRIGYPRRLDRDLLILMSGHFWELVEGSYAPHVLRDPLPGSRAAHVLFQIGLYDTSTSNIASSVAARTIGLPLLAPATAPIWGLGPAVAPTDSALILYDLGAAPLADSTLAPQSANIVHEGVRQDPRAQLQIVSFLRPTGEIVDACGGPCGPRKPEQP